MTNAAAQIATTLSIQPQQAAAAIKLLDEGASVPFIARYRKEQTNGLDDNQLRDLAAEYEYFQALTARRESILESIESQGKLTPELAAKIQAVTSKQALEDLYLPYKPKRRTKAQIAIEAGIQPLAEQIMVDPNQFPEALAADYLNPESGFDSAATVLEGARDILAEQWSELPELVMQLREFVWTRGLLVAKQVESGEQKPNADKFRDYFDYHEALAKVPSHRALAIFRGRNEAVLSAKVALGLEKADQEQMQSRVEGMIAAQVGWQDRSRAADAWIAKVVHWTWKVKLQLSLERDCFSQLKSAAEEEAIKVFGKNIRDLLLAAPAGAKAVLGLDPGIRTGVKVAAVDVTGKLLTTTTVYPHPPKQDWQGSIATLAALVDKHQIDIIAIGNGTASRETDKLAADVIKAASRNGVQKVMISEAGASVYSASEYASREMPDIDVSLRGAVSIARRLQDPLAELVKIEPKSIGVGQYQHDVNQVALSRELDAVVEDCVNAVGVDVNTASAPLLERVSGLSATMASNVVNQRETQGAFESRKALLSVPGIGPKAFEQAAGFLRIRDGKEPLDASSVHPESYPIVEQLLSAAGKLLSAVMGNNAEITVLRTTAKQQSGQMGAVGDYTLNDILDELEKPGRDPRPEFVMAKLSEGIETLSDLRSGMRLEGTVTNVANFGAFVDIGVHQDGLVHISQLADKFVQNPADVVKTGDIVNVTVLEVEPQRKRISLSMKADPELPTAGASASTAGKSSSKSTPKSRQSPRGKTGSQPRQSSTIGNSAMADAFAKLKR